MALDTEIDMNLPPATQLERDMRSSTVATVDQDRAEAVRRGNLAVSRAVTPRDGRGALPSLDELPAEHLYSCPVKLPHEVFTRLLQNDNFRSLGDHTLRQKFLEFAGYLYDHASSQERPLIEKALTDLLARKTEDGGSVLQAIGPSGKSLAQTLIEFSQHPETALGPGMTSALKGNMVLSTVLDLADPDRITQGQDITCTVTVAQIELARLFPERYAEAMYGLTTGRAVLGGGAMVLDLNAADLAEEGPRGRSITSRVFQGGVKDFVAMAEEGMYDGQVEDFLEAMYGRAFRRIDRQNAPDLDLAIRDLENALGSSPCVMVSMNWAGAGDEHEFHALSVRHIENGRVYLKNPWGTEFDLPPGLQGYVRMEPGGRWECSMDLETFKSRFNYAMLSDNQAVLGRTAGAATPEDAQGRGRTIFITPLEIRRREEEKKRKKDLTGDVRVQKADELAV